MKNGTGDKANGADIVLCEEESRREIAAVHPGRQDTVSSILSVFKFSDHIVILIFLFRV